MPFFHSVGTIDLLNDHYQFCNPWISKYMLSSAGRLANSLKPVLECAYFSVTFIYSFVFSMQCSYSCLPLPETHVVCVVQLRTLLKYVSLAMCNCFTKMCCRLFLIHCHRWVLASSCLPAKEQCVAWCYNSYVRVVKCLLWRQRIPYCVLSFFECLFECVNHKIVFFQLIGHRSLYNRRWRGKEI